MTRRTPAALSAVATLMLAVLVPTAAHAADAIATDRPDFVESSDVVGKGRVQIETGVSFERNKTADERTRARSTPTLIRVGVSDTLELRAESETFVRSSITDRASGAVQRDSGTADVSLGLKWHMLDGNEAAGQPAVAWLLHADVDSGSPAFRGKGVRPSLRGVAEWELPGDAALGVMGGAVLDRQPEGKRFTSGILAVTVSKGWTPEFRTFLEVAGRQFASKANGGNVLTLDAGVTYLLSDDLQIDAAVARGLNKNTADLQFGLGVSVRF